MNNALPNTATNSSIIDGVKKRQNKLQPTDCTIKRIQVTSCEEIKENPTGEMFHTKNATLNLRKLFQFIGFSMTKRHRCAYVLYSIAINGTICVFLPLSCLISYWRLAQTGFADVDVGLFLTSLQLFFDLLACDLKLLTLFLMRRKWRSCYPIMERLDESCRQAPDEMNEVRKLVKLGSWWVVFYLTAYTIYLVGTGFGAYMKDRPPFNVYLPYLDYRTSTAQFWLVSFIELSMVGVVVFQQGFCDSFAVVHVCLLRAHMRILLLRFAKLGSGTLSLEQNYEALKQCIRDHKTYLELYDLIAPVVQITVFIQFLLTANLLSTTLINFMIIETDFTSRIGHFFYIAAIFLQISPVCYNAQCLMDDSDRLATVIFHSNWIDQDVRYRKMLIFLMQRVQNPKMLMAGKLFPINLSCCLSIIKFSFSLYTFIKTMGLEEKFADKL